MRAGPDLVSITVPQHMAASSIFTINTLNNILTVYFLFFCSLFVFLLTIATRAFVSFLGVNTTLGSNLTLIKPQEKKLPLRCVTRFQIVVFYYIYILNEGGGVGIITGFSSDRCARRGDCPHIYPPLLLNYHAPCVYLIDES